MHQRREHVVKVFKVPTMMSCGQGGAKPLASESRLLQARFAIAAMRAQVHVQARTGGADGGSCGGGGMHGCKARKRSAWGSVAGHVCAAAGMGATGEERRRTTTSTGGSSCRSMHHRWDVDLGLEDVQIGVDEPPEKTPRAEIKSSLPAWLVSVMAPPTPKSAT